MSEGGGDPGGRPPREPHVIGGVRPEAAALSDKEQAIFALGLPFALQTARRKARRITSLKKEDLESLACVQMAELSRLYSAELGTLKSFVSTRVGFALRRAAKKERDAAVIEAEVALSVGLWRSERLPPCLDAVRGEDETAHERLLTVASEAADAAGLHLAEMEERVAIVQGVIAELSSFVRKVVEKHYLDGKSFRQIATELNCSTSKVYRAQERALPRLRSRLRRLRGV